MTGQSFFRGLWAGKALRLQSAANPLALGWDSAHYDSEAFRAGLAAGLATQPWRDKPDIVHRRKTPEDEKEQQAGIVRTGYHMTLHTVYKQPVTSIIYYGQWKYSGLTDYSVFDILIGADQTEEGLIQAAEGGTRVFYYIPFGSRFRLGEDGTGNAFVAELEALILSLPSAVGGIFFDECEVGYWRLDYYGSDLRAAPFERALEELCDFCEWLGLETVINGVQAYCNLGTYFLWESFTSYWSTSGIQWLDGGTGRSESAIGTVTYSRPWGDWTFSGSVHVDEESGKVVDGSDGTMSMNFDIETVINAGERQEGYPWVYFEWFGSGADDNTLEIYAAVGDTWPPPDVIPTMQEVADLKAEGKAPPTDWVMLDKLWKGEPASWDGINKTSRYIRVELHFHGADALSMDSAHLFYNYVYPAYDMTQSADSDNNPRYWGFNLGRARYLWARNARVLCHCYGTRQHEWIMRYTFTAFKMFDYEGWDFTHPLHQDIRWADILDEPFGCLLKRTELGDGKFHGVFSGCTAELDVKNNTYAVQRSEPEYWFDVGLPDDTFTDDMLFWTNPHPWKRGVYLMWASLDADDPIPDEWEVTNSWLYPSDGDWGHTDPDTGEWVDGVLDKRGVNYYLKLPERLNLRRFWIYDDLFYLYFGAEYAESVEFGALIPDSWFIYLCSPDVSWGYRGEWFQTSRSKAQYMIYNQSLFKWREGTDETDYRNFRYIGNTYLQVEVSGTEAYGKNTMLKYTLKKSVLGEANTKNMYIYAVLEKVEGSGGDPSRMVGMMADSIDSLVDPVAVAPLPYVQRRNGLFSPHGYYRSASLSPPSTQRNACGVTLTWRQSCPDHTSVSVWVRVRRYGAEAWEDYEAASGTSWHTDAVIERMQFVAALNTTDGHAAPVVEDVKWTWGSELTSPPGPLP